MSKTKISVILTCYNNENYLKDSLYSLTKQSFNDFELIIVNDGSTDSSLDIIMSFAKKDSRIKVINQSNQGAATARNNGIKAAKGEYLSILDSDDIFDLAMLEEMYSKAKENNLDILICPFKYVSDNKNIKRGLTIPCEINDKEVFSSSDIKNSLFQLSSPSAWNKLFKREFIVKNNIEFQNLSSCNDLYFSYYALALANRISILNKAFVSYRNDATGAISRNRGDKFNNIFLAMEKLKSSLIKDALFDDFKLSFLKRAISNLVYESNNINDTTTLTRFIANSGEFLLSFSENK